MKALALRALRALLYALWIPVALVILAAICGIALIACAVDSYCAWRKRRRNAQLMRLIHEEW